MPNFAHFVLCMFVMQLEPSPARILPVSPLTKKKSKASTELQQSPCAVGGDWEMVIPTPCATADPAGASAFIEAE